LADGLLNIILFLPLGVALGLYHASLRRALLLAALLSALIELVQFAIPARVPSVGDVLSNSIGAALGWSLVWLAPHWLRPPRVAAARLSLIAALCVMGATVLTGFLVSPAPPHSTYSGQWTPNLDHLEWYRGRVLRAELASLPLPSRRLEDSDSVRALLLEGAPLTVEAVAGPRPPGLASLFSIYDREERQVALVGVDRDDLVFNYRTRALALTLDQPDLRLRRVMSAFSPGDTISVRVARHGQAYCMTIGATERCGLGFTAGDGWKLLFHPEHLPRHLGWALNLVFLAGLAAPVGYWVRARWESAVAVVVLVAGMALVPRWTGLLPITLAELLASLAGLGLGSALYHWVNRRVPASDSRTAQP
jgi:hypothetical protein